MSLSSTKTRWVFGACSFFLQAGKRKSNVIFGTVASPFAPAYLPAKIEVSERSERTPF